MTEEIKPTNLGLQNPEKLRVIFGQMEKIKALQFDDIRKLKDVIESAMAGCGSSCGGC